MKGQRYRFRLIALLLAGLLILAGVYGFRTIPLTDTGGSLRDAILRLTGRATPTPSAVSSISQDAESPTPAPSDDSSPPVESASDFLTNGLGQIILPQSSDGTPSLSPEPTPDVSPPAETTAGSLTGVIQQVLFPQASDSIVSPAQELTPDVSPSAETTAGSLTGVIQQVLFPQATASPGLTPDETSSAATTPAPPLSEMLSNYFGTENSP